MLQEKHQVRGHDPAFQRFHQRPLNSSASP
jgi:hypothetical protein